MFLDFLFKRTKKNPVHIVSEGMVLQKTAHVFENVAVFNPGCIEKDGLTHMFYRAVSGDNFSTIGYCVFKGSELIERKDTPVLYSEFEYEKHGLEDPRITCIDGTYYLLYTAYDGTSARIAYAESTDLRVWRKCGVISPSFAYSEALSLMNRKKVPGAYFWYGKHYQRIISKDVLVWDKDAVLFPKKIGGKYAMLHRIMPGIQIVYFDTFEELQKPEFWKNYIRELHTHTVMEPAGWFESRIIGAGAVPIETEYGWVLLYHGVENTSRTYHAGAALLDLTNPRKVLGRLKEPLFSPADRWEKNGEVKNVVFPTGTILQNNGRLLIYYGAGDGVIEAKSLDFKELVTALRNSK